MTKTVEVTVDISIAKRMLNIAGYHDIKGKSDEEVFAKVLAMIEKYGAKSVVKEN